jgi:hypothetical protein
VKRIELETIINYNMEEDLATAFSYDRKFKNRMAALGIEPIEDNGQGGLTYQFDKKMVPLPRASRKGARVLTKAQKAAVRERFAAARAEKAAATAVAPKKGAAVKKVAKAPVEVEEEPEPAPVKKAGVKKAAPVVVDDAEDEVVVKKPAIKKVPAK